MTKALSLIKAHSTQTWRQFSFGHKHIHTLTPLHTHTHTRTYKFARISNSSPGRISCHLVHCKFCYWMRDQSAHLGTLFVPSSPWRGAHNSRLPCTVSGRRSCPGQLHFWTISTCHAALLVRQWRAGAARVPTATPGVQTPGWPGVDESWPRLQGQAQTL